MANGKSVLVLGGGVAGLCVAYFALEKGHRVQIIERGAPSHDSCSLGNAGMVVPSHIIPLAAPGMVQTGLKMMFRPESPFALRPRLSRDLVEWGLRFCRAANANHVDRSAPVLRDLNLGSRAEYVALAERFENAFGLTQRGLLMLCKQEETLKEEAHLAERAQKLGLIAEVLSAKETAQRDPHIAMNVAGSVYFAQDCHLNPQRFVACLTEAIRAKGGEFLWETEAIGWRREGERVVAAQTNRGEVSAEEFVIAGGAWSPLLAKGLGLRLPMQAGKGYSMTLERPRELPETCAILTEARIAVTPMGGALRFAGTMEVTGLDLSVNASKVQGIRKSIPDYYPNFRPDDFQETPVWSGLRPCSPDGLPYIGKLGAWRNVYAATGHAMMGVSLAPITGKLIASLLSQETPSLSLEAVRPDRFA